MGKKKRQSEPANMDNDNESTESCDENQNASVCPHIGKAVDISKIKRMLLSGIDEECSQCEKNPVENGPQEADYEYDLSLWLCLRCGHQGCGRGKRRHSLAHFNTPRSDCHALCVNTTVWEVWCYACNMMVNPSIKKKLLETVEWLKKQNPAQKPVIPLAYETLDAIELENLKNTAQMFPKMSELPRVRGLTNLGNTCFFNAVMQCLAQTPFLQPILQELETTGEAFQLPGGQISQETGNSATGESEQPPLAGDGSGEADDLQLSGGSGSPGKTYDGEQLSLASGTSVVTPPPPPPQNSTAGNSNNNNNKNTNTNKSLALPPLQGTLAGWGPLTEVLSYTLNELTTGRVAVYNPRALLSQLTLRQPLFGGGDQHDSHELLRYLLENVRSEDLRRYQTVILEKLGFSKRTDPSTVEGFTKQVIKFYGQQASDLMVRTDQIFRGVLVSTLQCQDCKHSSHRDEFFLDLSLPVSADKQIPPALRRKSDVDMMESEKPNKSQLKKEKRAARKARKQRSSSTITEEQAGENKSESEESDADVEDNLEDCKSPEGFETKGLESGYNSEKISDASPELNALEIDSGVTSPLTVTTVLEADSPHSGSSEANIEMTSPQMQTSMSPEDYERPISRLSFADKPTPMIEEKIVDPVQEESGDAGQQRLEPMFGTRWCGTVSARYQCDEGECSVQSCLNQFTACELMTGNNRVACENCTRNINGKNGKSVCTNATKQLLISSPPAILILHLKRFQVSRCFPRKMCKHVTFPLILDMAPFCSNRCRDLPSIDEQQNKLLYSLYGIVEHSGTLHGGHYVAYVKVRPSIPKDNYRWHFLSKTPSHGHTGPSSEGGASGDPTPPPGRWYYVSDSNVSEVPESKVLRAQAYLLFYERIL